ncbi:hypothetical protein [Bosea sp. ASV33]|uniref:hypothetical protein n=1 Tax=Bosea sp. ASV33 TaxID=2795106 RepID=UPI0018EA5DF7|nr:hypothetical protein [Bosea sp. ASV33]
MMIAASWSSVRTRLSPTLEILPTAEEAVLASTIAFYFALSGQRVDADYGFADIELELMFASIRASGNLQASATRVGVETRPAGREED